MSTIEKAIDKLGRTAGKSSPGDEAPDLITDEPAPAQAAADKPPEVAQAVAQEAPSAPATAEVSPGKIVRIDRGRLREQGIIEPDVPKSNKTAEEFRRIKSPLLAHARGEGATIVDNPNLIMVTSSIAGEGKTYTSINLAMSMAMEMEKTVLLVDADVAKPDVTEILGVQADRGLIDVLANDKLNLEDVLMKTDVPNFTILPAGSRHARSTELLGSDSMRVLAHELATRYSDRIIVFDSPPLLLTTEAKVLAGLMGQIVLVVENSKTSQMMVRESLSMLEESEIIGLVLNKIDRRIGGDYYGYGGYGYGSYGYGYGR